MANLKDPKKKSWLKNASAKEVYELITQINSIQDVFMGQLDKSASLQAGIDHVFAQVNDRPSLVRKSLVMGLKDSIRLMPNDKALYEKYNTAAIAIFGIPITPELETPRQTLIRLLDQNSVSNLDDFYFLTEFLSDTDRKKWKWTPVQVESLENMLFHFEQNVKGEED